MFLQNTTGGCFWTNLGDLCGLLCGEAVFWLFCTILPWLSNIMLNLLTKSSFDISLLFKLKYAAILLLRCCELWISHVIMNHFVYTNTQTMISLKRNRQFLGVKKLKWFLLFSGVDISGSVSKQNFYACARAKKSDVAATFRLHSV